MLSTFWALNSYDLQVPLEAYKREIDRISKTANELDAQVCLYCYIFIINIVYRMTKPIARK
jgi:hypothetical protein